MKRFIVAVVAVASLGVVGCSGLPLTQTYMLPSSLVGAGLGAIIDEDNREEGALIGAVLGAGVGGMADTYLNTSGSQQQTQQPQQGQCWVERRGNTMVQICPQGQSRTAYAAAPYHQQGYGQQSYSSRPQSQSMQPCRDEQEFTGQYDAYRQPIYRVVRKCYGGQQYQGGYSQGGYSSQGGGNGRYYQP